MNHRLFVAPLLGAMLFLIALQPAHGQQPAVPDSSANPAAPSTTPAAPASGAAAPTPAKDPRQFARKGDPSSAMEKARFVAQNAICTECHGVGTVSYKKQINLPNQKYRDETRTETCKACESSTSCSAPPAATTATSSMATEWSR